MRRRLSSFLHCRCSLARSAKNAVATRETHSSRQDSPQGRMQGPAISAQQGLVRKLGECHSRRKDKRANMRGHSHLYVMNSADTVPLQTSIRRRGAREACDSRRQERVAMRLNGTLRPICLVALCTILVQLSFVRNSYGDGGSKEHGRTVYVWSTSGSGSPGSSATRYRSLVRVRAGNRARTSEPVVWCSYVAAASSSVAGLFTPTGHGSLVPGDVSWRRSHALGRQRSRLARRQCRAPDIRLSQPSACRRRLPNGLSPP